MQTDPYVEAIKATIRRFSRSKVEREAGRMLAQAAGVVMLVAEADDEKHEAIDEALRSIQRRFGPALAERMAATLDKVMVEVAA